MGLLPARALLAPLALALGAPALAQDRDQPLRPCTGLSSPADEIACLRALLQAATPSPDPIPAADQPPVPEQRPAGDAPVEKAAALGAEQVAVRQPRAARSEPSEAAGVSAAIVEVRSDARGLLVMLLDNGQIWRQDESLTIPLRLDQAARAAVRIHRSGFGGYRMDFPEIDRRIVVSRLR